MLCGTMQMFINIHSGVNIVQKDIQSFYTKTKTEQNQMITKWIEFEYPDPTFI